MPDRKYTVTITDGEQTIEVHATLFVMRSVLRVLESGHPFFYHVVTERLGKAVAEELLAFYVCKTLPDTDNPEWQATAEEFRRLSKLLKH